ncbi:Protein CBG25924 [Caenorhabditis briggsae]|uniref:Protein CBG25924 n=1 Tax=Caenorhabditis briggsae TaxID=6238 RepID=B6IK56_CAEBR|nr:Protein CBG25924 [Caenorhabditis briggsae]CAS00286.1 Protein CBG25924 [Caenorhabditis briggsae]
MSIGSEDDSSKRNSNYRKVERFILNTKYQSFV